MELKKEEFKRDVENYLKTLFRRNVKEATKQQLISSGILCGERYNRRTMDGNS